MRPSITLRSATAEDEPLLLRIYAATRAEELEQVPWSKAERAAFLTYQFASRREEYRERFPDASRRIILVDGTPAGFLCVDRPAHEIRIVDIALLPEYRSRGVGSALVGELLGEAEATSRPIRIHVEARSRAVRFYARLGFRPCGERGTHVRMEWTPDDLSPCERLRLESALEDLRRNSGPRDDAIAIALPGSLTAAERAKLLASILEPVAEEGRRS